MLGVTAPLGRKIPPRADQEADEYRFWQTNYSPVGFPDSGIMFQIGKFLSILGLEVSFSQNLFEGNSHEVSS